MALTTLNTSSDFCTNKHSRVFLSLSLASCDGVGTQDGLSFSDGGLPYNMSNFGNVVLMEQEVCGRGRKLSFEKSSRGSHMGCSKQLKQEESSHFSI